MTQKALQPCRGHRLRRPPFRHDGDAARPASTPTSSASSCCATSKSAGTPGRFGKEYDECDDLDKRRNWDKKLGLGRKKIFEVRRVHNDITFIDTFLTPEFCVRHKMFSLRLPGAGRAVRHRVARVRENQAAAAVQLDELRKTVDLCSRRQFPQPRRAAAAAPAQRRRTAPRPGRRHPGQHPVHLGPARASANARRRQADDAVLRRHRPHHQNRRRDR